MALFSRPQHQSQRHLLRHNHIPHQWNFWSASSLRIRNVFKLDKHITGLFLLHQQGRAMLEGLLCILESISGVSNSSRSTTSIFVVFVAKYTSSAGFGSAMSSSFKSCWVVVQTPAVKVSETNWDVHWCLWCIGELEWKYPGLWANLCTFQVNVSL